MNDRQRLRIAVIGGGISGLSAAWFVRRQLVDAVQPGEVTVFEASDRLGGCLRSTTLHDALPITADTGAEAALARRPEAVELADRLGLARQTPGTTRSGIYSSGKLRPIPTGTVMGVPGDPAGAIGVLTPDEVARAEAERLTEPVDDDTSVGDWIAARLGAAVTDRLLDPLLGGVYAGNARLLSLRATVPALWPAAQAGTSVLEAVRHNNAAVAAKAAEARARGEEAQPVFMGLEGGMARLISELARRLAATADRPAAEVPVNIRTSTPVTHLARTATPGSGAAEEWRLVAGGEPHVFDAVIVALPAHAASRLLSDAVPAATGELSRIEHASSAVVTALVNLEGGQLEGSGLLVPPSQTTVIKAATFSSNKWPWLRRHLPAGTALLRTSVGRFGDPGWLHSDDDKLTRAALGDLERIVGRRLPVVASELTRWDESLPQYAVGHLDRVARIRRAVSAQAGLALAGAAYDGVGIPACVASAERAARIVTAS
ncbi:protoporphyrinogen oxidase [Saxibacter everestensis]|uniref:Coproporphyrinogen III oxidase n=1 Tax=Saxibacter everestensis TaxID=2909229 RepID=A0ABY8QWM3_9MICO|nr:protoporphyrinogen oxidase [Brevibacteriaceae bacterium ZFBP1038]